MATATSALPHRIGGGSAYDTDMDIIEMFVESYQHPENETNQAGVKLYYGGQLHVYWHVLKKYIFSAAPEQDIADGVLFNDFDPFQSKVTENSKRLTLVELNKIRSAWPQLEKEFNQAVANIIAEKLNLESIWQIFYFMSKLFCLKNPDIPDDDMFHLIKRVYQMNSGTDDGFEEYYDRRYNAFYPLTNNTGFFSVNTYVYSYLEGIDVVGVPSQVNDVEGERRSCAVPFIFHDIDHQFRMWQNLTDEDRAIYKEIHRKIINDSKLSIDEKELHILCMWMVLHEILADPDHFYFDATSEMGLTNLTQSTIVEYGSEFVKFKPIFYTKETLTDLYSRNIKFEQSYDFTDLWHISSWDDLTANWESKDHEFLVLCMMAITYSTTYVRKHYMD